MTTYKSDAVESGLHADKTIPGLVLCRTGRYTTEDDSLVSADVIQMVPVPVGAQVIDVDFYCSGDAALATGIDMGDGGDPDRYFAGLTFTGDHVYGKSAMNPVGFDKVYSTDDTVDIVLVKTAADTKVPTDIEFVVNVWYKMQGALDDEDA